MRVTVTLWLAWVIIIAGFALAMHGSGMAEAVNARTHCHADGWPCVVTCDPNVVTFDPPPYEDDPCWLIVADNSDYEVPMLARLFGARDYR